MRRSPRSSLIQMAEGRRVSSQPTVVPGVGSRPNPWPNRISPESRFALRIVGASIVIGFLWRAGVLRQVVEDFGRILWEFQRPRLGTLLDKLGVPRRVWLRSSLPKAVAAGRWDVPLALQAALAANANPRAWAPHLGDAARPYLSGAIGRLSLQKSRSLHRALASMVGLPGTATAATVRRASILIIVSAAFRIAREPSTWLEAWVDGDPARILTRAIARDLVAEGSEHALALIAPSPADGSPSGHVERVAEARLEVEGIVRAIRRLPSTDQALVRMVAEGESVAAAARQLGLSPDAGRQRVLRLRRWLRLITGYTS